MNTCHTKSTRMRNGRLQGRAGAAVLASEIQERFDQTIDRRPPNPAYRPCKRIIKAHIIYRPTTIADKIAIFVDPDIPVQAIDI